jgi:hypothetical protein
MCSMVNTNFSILSEKVALGMYMKQRAIELVKLLQSKNLKTNTRTERRHLSNERFRSCRNLRIEIAEAAAACQIRMQTRHR